MRSIALRSVIAVLVCCSLGCSGDDDGDTGADGTGTDSDGTTNGGSNTTPSSSTTNGGSNTNGNTSSTPDDTGEPDVTGEPSGECDFSDAFDGNADAWPSTWEIAGGVATADVVDGRARLAPVTNNYSLARLYTDRDCVDAEVTFAFEFTDASSQGIGVYVRQNGGHLQTTTPPGTGYAVFIEAFRQPSGIGLWREVDGSEQQIESIVASTVTPGVVYRARVRVTQSDADTTLLQARMWADGDAEPSSWQIERMDQTPGLQNTGGGLAIDAYSSRTSGDAAELFIDDVVMTAAQ